MAGRFVVPISAEYDSSGDPIPGAKLYFYESGTSSPLDTFSDDALTTANANPVVADSGGRFGPIFLKDQDYKVVLTDAADVNVWDDPADPVRAAEPTATTVIEKTTTYTVTLANNGYLIEADATSGAFTITLPPAATAGNGFTIAVKKVDSSGNAVTVDADGSETIDGNSDVSLANQNDVVQVRSNGTEWRAIVLPLVRQNLPLPRGSIDGLILSNNASDSDHDIDISAGMCRDGDDGVNMILSSALTKRIDAAWAVGDGNGGLDTGSVTTDTWYHVWLIRRSDTGVVDALFSTSATAPTMPTNYDQKRRIGAVLTDGSSNILAFKQRPSGHFEWVTPIFDVDDSTPTSSDAGDTYTLSVPPNTRAAVNLYVAHSSSTTAAAYLRPTDITDDTPDFGALPASTIAMVAGGASAARISAKTEVWVDASSQVKISVNTGDDELGIATLGWWDPRGRDD